MKCWQVYEAFDSMLRLDTTFSGAAISGGGITYQAHSATLQKQLIRDLGM